MLFNKPMAEHIYTTLSWPMGKWHKLVHTSNNVIKKNQYMLGNNKYNVEKKREFSSELRVLNLLTSTNCYKIFNHSDSFVWYCEKCQMNVNNFDTFWKIHLCQKNPNWTLSCMITYTSLINTAQHSSVTCPYPEGWWKWKPVGTILCHHHA